MPNCTVYTIINYAFSMLCCLALNCHIMITGGHSFSIGLHYSLKLLNTRRIHFHIAQGADSLSDIAEPLLYPTIILNEANKVFTLFCPHINNKYVIKEDFGVDETLEAQCSQLVFHGGTFDVLIG